jgi:hypothetical protein
MTQRYNELINAIGATDKFILQMFLFAFFVVLAYPVLQWVPARVRKPFTNIYLATVLILFIFTTVFSSGQ